MVTLVTLHKSIMRSPLEATYIHILHKGSFGLIRQRWSVSTCTICFIFILNKIQILLKIMLINLNTLKAITSR